MKRALIIFAKTPVPGKVKTRLTSVLSSEEAAAVYRCMLFDTLAKAGQVPGTNFLFYEPSAVARSYFEEIAGGMELYPQQGDSLGERMESAFKQVLALGYEAVAIIGTDSPDLPRNYIAEAFERLEDSNIEAVFGPSADGGYYLLAMRRLQPELFSGISWSSDTVLRDSLDKAERAGLAVHLLPPWHDVDTADDLLRPELQDESNDAPLTREFIVEYIFRRRISPDAQGVISSSLGK